MRISDWSSDVCSSDLVNEQLEARRSFIEAVLSGVSSAVVSVDAGRRILLANAAAERLIGQSAESLTGQLLDDVAPELARLLTGEEREGIVQLSRKDAEPATLAAKARSEEHTSELQSLMRSSYAVFCLKKKNRQIL